MRPADHRRPRPADAALDESRTEKRSLAEQVHEVEASELTKQRRTPDERFRDTEGLVRAVAGAVQHIVQAFGLDKTMSKLHDLFSAMERGTMSAKEVGAVFDDVFGEVIPLALDKSTGRLNDQARELLRMAQTRGVQSEQISSLVASEKTMLGRTRALMRPA